MLNISGLARPLSVCLLLLGCPGLLYAAAEYRARVGAPDDAAGELGGTAGPQAGSDTDSGASAIEEALKKAASHVGRGRAGDEAPRDTGPQELVPVEDGIMGAGHGEAPDDGLAAPKGNAVGREESPESADAAQAAPEKVAQGQPQEEEDGGLKQGTFANVTNECLREGGPREPKIILWYPRFGNTAVDADILAFVKKAAAEYHDEVAAGAEGEPPSNYDKWELSGTFDVERPSNNVGSVTFSIYAYSGGAHGNMAITALNYDLVDGRRLEFDDLFGAPETALDIMSRLSAIKLARSLGEDADDSMIADGTAPSLQNFRNLTLVPDGLVIEFQPYQVGPWSIGPQRTRLTLEELAPALPNPAVWKNEGAIKK